MGKSTSNNNPFLLGADDNVITAKRTTGKQQPASNPLLLGAEDTKYVKKKVDGESSGQNTFPTPSGFEPPSISPESINKAGLAYQNKQLTPDDITVLASTDFGKQKGFDKLTTDQKQLFAEAYNGQTKEDLFNSVVSKINSFYPADVQNPAKSKVRDEILKGVQSGNQDTIIKTRDGITNNLQQKINDIYSKVISDFQGGFAANMGGATGEKIDVSNPFVEKALTPEQRQTVQSLKKQISDVNNSFNDYGRSALLSSDEMKMWLRMDESHENLLGSAAATWVGKNIHKLYGNGENSGNTEYDRNKDGLAEMINNLKMEVNDLVTKGLPTKNPDLLKQANDKINTLQRYRKWYDELDTKQFPDVGYANTQRVIQDELADIHHNKLIYSKKDKQDAVYSYAKKNPGWADKYGQFANDIVGKDVWMSHPGVTGGLTRGMFDVTASLTNLLGLTSDERKEALETGTFQKGTTKSGTAPTKIVYDTNGKAYREMPNENYGSWDINNSIAKISQSIPQLAEWILLDKGAGAAFKAGLEGAELARVGSAVNKIAEAGKLSEESQRTLGLVGATYLTSYNGNRKLADELITGNGDFDEAKKNVLANVLTLSTAAAFKMVDYSPSKFAENLVAKQAMPDALKVLENENFETLSEKGWSTILKENILPKVKALAKAQAESTGTGLKVGAASVLDQKVKDFISVVVNPDKAKVSSTADNINSVVEQTLLMSIVGLPTSIVHGVFEPTTKDALYTSGLYSAQYIDRINKMLDDGTITKEKANTLISVVKTMGEEVVKAGFGTNKDGLPMITRQKKDLAINNFRQRAAQAMKEGGGEVDYEKIVNEVTANNDNIKSGNYFTPIEETPVFKSAYDEETGKKLTSMDDIVPEKQYTYEKESGKPVTTTGAELINHLENEELYEEKPSPKTTEIETEIPKGENKEPAKTEEKKTVIPEPLTDEKKKEAADFANELKSEGIVPDTYHDMIKPEDATGFWEMVAQQAQNVGANWKPLEGEENKSEQAARDAFGDTIVDYAKELFPVSEEQPTTVKVGDKLKIGNSEWEVTEDNGDTVKAVNKESNVATSFSKEDANKNISSQSKTSTDGSNKKEKSSQENAPNAQEESIKKEDAGVLNQGGVSTESTEFNKGVSETTAGTPSLELQEIKNNHQKSIERLEKKADKMTKKEQKQLDRLKDRKAIIDKFSMSSEDLINALKEKGKLEQICP